MTHFITMSNKLEYQSQISADCSKSIISVHILLFRKFLQNIEPKSFHSLTVHLISKSINPHQSLDSTRFIVIQMQPRNPNEYDMLAKIFVDGEHFVGKTSTALRYCTEEWNPNALCTIGVDFRIKNITLNGKRIKLQVWDMTGGQRFRTLSNVYYRGCHGVLLIIDLTNSEALDYAGRRLARIRQFTANNPYTYILLFGNKSDLTATRALSAQRIEEFARSEGLEYMEGSAKLNININQTFEKMTTQILNNFVANPNPTPHPAPRNRSNDQLPSEPATVQRQNMFTMMGPALLLAVFVFLALAKDFFSLTKGLA